MKVSKKLSNKLTLKKETIANLENAEMKGIYGGTSCDCTHFPCAETGEVCSYPFKCKPE